MTATTRAVIFDFGGTLFSYAGTVRGSGRARAFANWIGWEDEDLGPVVRAIRGAIAQSAAHHAARPFFLHRDLYRDSGRLAAEALGRTLSETHAAAWAEQYVTGLGDLIAPRPGLHETLEAIRKRGIHIGAASNADCDQFEVMVDALAVRPYFDSLLCSEAAQSCKPDQRIFQIALERAGCAPHEAVFVGDTPDADIIGAERAGMRAILIEETTAIAFERGAAKDGQVTIRELPELLQHL